MIIRTFCVRVSIVDSAIISVIECGMLVRYARIATMMRCMLLGRPAFVAFLVIVNPSVVAEIATTAMSDPFAYCSQVGSIDTPAGGASPVPIALNPYLGRALGLSAAVEMRPESYYWRCMDRMVYVCAIGANIPCDRKADRSKRNVGAEKFCQENRESAVVPAYATGHDGIYAWSCSLGNAVRGQRMVKLDSRGYRVDIWHQVLRNLP